MPRQSKTDNIDKCAEKSQHVCTDVLHVGPQPPKQIE